MPALLLALAIGEPPTGGPGGSSTPAPVVQAQAGRPKDHGWDALAVPLVSYNTDDRFGYGVAGGAYIYRPGYTPYAQGIALQVYATQSGLQNHYLRYDGPHFLGSPYRVEGRLELLRERRTPYYGPGNEAAPGIVNFDSDPYYQYDQRSYGGWARARRDPIPALLNVQPYLGYVFHQNAIGVNPGSLLDQEQPRGIGGGPTGLAMVGLIWDTRDDEANPSKGGWRELSLRAGDGVTGSHYSYGEATVVLKQFFQLWPGVVWGGRLLGDQLFGQYPFFALNDVGGNSETTGLGGISSVRGLPRDRYVGATKILANTELRWTFYQRPVLGQITQLGGVGFADAGRAVSPGVDNGPWYQFHPGVGLGLRLIRRQAVVRFDYGISEDRTSVYLTFGQVF